MVYDALIALFRFSEKYLLLDDASSTRAKESGLSMVQREMARQWFGNLVTCSWWNYLWLHDAFATYFQYFSMDSVRSPLADWLVFAWLIWRISNRSNHMYCFLRTTKSSRHACHFKLPLYNMIFTGFEIYSK